MSRRGGGASGVALTLGVLIVAFTAAVTSCRTTQTAPRSAALPPPGTEGYVGAETCKGCHAEAFTKFASTKMGRLFLHHPRNDLEGAACENCHGPGKAHVEAGGGKGVGGLITFRKNDSTPVETRNAVCVQCHQRGPHLFWQGSAHEARDVACTNCHKVMEDVSPKFQLAKATEIETCGQCHLERRAQQMRSSHMPLREGKMTCTSCHNPHGGVTQHNLKAMSTNETCFLCHAEKRGPFLWEHAPATENCTYCHDPHGSNHEKMLKLAKPRLCQQCHVVTRHPTRPYGQETSPSNLKFILGKGCTNCHFNIHGSNHPSGFAFTR
jgi:DmsE family decaheme c-type cytochrome